MTGAFGGVRYRSLVANRAPGIARSQRRLQARDASEASTC